MASSFRRASKSGYSRELQMKLSAKYDPEVAGRCLVWIRDVINSSLGPITRDLPLQFYTDGSPTNFSKTLHDGVVLATLANCLMPGSVPKSRYTNPPKLAFKQMELIELFVRKAKEFGVPDHDAFQTVDLYEDQNLHQVVICLQSLSRKAKSRGLTGFGPKEAEANPRRFTEQQLKAGDNIIGLQMGTNKGATQSGMTFGKQRMILD